MTRLRLGLASLVKQVHIGFLLGEDGKEVLEDMRGLAHDAARKIIASFQAERMT